LRRKRIETKQLNQQEGGEGARKRAQREMTAYLWYNGHASCTRRAELEERKNEGDGEEPKEGPRRQTRNVVS